MYLKDILKEGKRMSKLPLYITSFFSLDSVPELPTKQANELTIFKKFLNHEIVKPELVRFGDDGASEPDLVVKQGEQIIGVEITAIYGSEEIAKAYFKNSSPIIATEEQWLKAIADRYKDKLSDRKDGKKRYDRSKFDIIILLMDDRSGRDSSPKLPNPLRLLPNGTPVTNVTLFQQLFQPWSSVLDESYLLGRSSTNQLGTILVKGHLNID